MTLSYDFALNRRKVIRCANIFAIYIVQKQLAFYCSHSLLKETKTARWRDDRRRRQRSVDRHGPRPIPNVWHLPDLSQFSLSATFKSVGKQGLGYMISNRRSYCCSACVQYTYKYTISANLQFYNLQTRGIQRWNSWTALLVEVSGHKLESSKT